MVHPVPIPEMHAIPRRARRTDRINVGAQERIVSTIGGGLLIAYGLARRSLGSIVLALVGGSLVERGVTGHCRGYAMLGISTRGQPELSPTLGTERALGPVEAVAERLSRIERSITVARPIHEVYAFVRNFQNIPHFATHIERVDDLGGGRLRVLERGEHAHAWEMEIVEERPEQAIVLRHVGEPSAQLSILFTPAPFGRGTEIEAVLDLDHERGGAFILLQALSVLAGEAPDTVVRHDMRRLKMLLEAGEIVTVEGQPSGREPEVSRLVD
ncbi:YgaP-like transmembrane domain [Polyangium aurulentum]|uniref:YgaP-like transmembrane domain n=1 Tax=Polyangium aurulentum TaxID=2567896 RepID=UPI00146D163C|nr:YgaP-like transmembrane domain [Polyangium aurulentum]UQA58408.1 DUF2892 domain-containing protein [Polyangium aurulentum]